MAKPGSDRDGAMVDKQAGKKVRKHRCRIITERDISARSAARKSRVKVHSLNVDAAVFKMKLDMCCGAFNYITRS